MISSRLAPLLLVDVLLNISVQVDDHYFYIFIWLVIKFLYDLEKITTNSKEEFLKIFRTKSILMTPPNTNSIFSDNDDERADEGKSFTKHFQSLI